MVYILFFIFTFNGRPVQGVPEFNNKEACQAAAAELQKNAKSSPSYRDPIIFCAAKGEKK
jgi:hypothetical protein